MHNADSVIVMSPLFFLQVSQSGVDFAGSGYGTLS